jgi:putative SOS response-associated peptidase YedK
MGVLLAAEEIPLWLSGEPEAAALMRPLPDGQLSVGEATDVDWTAP